MFPHTTHIESISVFSRQRSHTHGKGQVRIQGFFECVLRSGFMAYSQLNLSFADSTSDKFIVVGLGGNAHIVGEFCNLLLVPQQQSLSTDALVHVHLQDCLQALQADVYDWLIRLSWQDEISAKFPVGIEVNVYHRTGLLSDISVIFMRENTNLLTIQMLSDNRKNTVILNMFTEVTTSSHFLMTSESVKQLSDVVCVERTIRLQR